MKKILAALKLVTFGIVISIYALCACVIFLTSFNSVKRRARLLVNTTRIARLMLFIFRVDLVCKNPLPKDEVSLLVGNHVGFIDIVCINALQPAVFITSLEIKHTPFLGQLSQLGACAYVNRLNRAHILDELQDIVKTLKQGFRVVLYAEAKTSNAEQVLPFKKTLMMAAGYADVPIRPFTFNYLKVNGRPVEYKDRDDVCWYGDQGFLPAIWRALQLYSIQCEIIYHDPAYIKPEDDRTEVSESIHTVVSSAHKPFKAPVTF